MKFSEVALLLMGFSIAETLLRAVFGPKTLTWKETLGDVAIFGVLAGIATFFFEK